VSGGDRQGVGDYSLADRVVAAHHRAVAVTATTAVAGSESMCGAFKASNLDPGGFAEYVRVPAANVRHAMFRVPEHVSDEAASFVEPAACCLRAVRRARVESGDTTVILGLGSIGCLFVQLLARVASASSGAIRSPSAPTSPRAWVRSPPGPRTSRWRPCGSSRRGAAPTR